MVKIMKDFQEESDTIRSNVLMDCQSRSKRTVRLEAGGGNGLEENDGRGNAVELNDCTCDQAKETRKPQDCGATRQEQPGYLVYFFVREILRRVTIPRTSELGST